MSKKINSAKHVNEIISAFRCPICESTMKVVELKSLICSNKHTFDFTKQGYINMMAHQSNSHYSKELFEARHNIIMEGNLYTEMHELISKVINDQMDVASSKPFMIVDLGCGEGSHLHRIIEGCKSTSINGVGLDISKEGIVMAAKRYGDQVWLVADLAKSPIKDQAFHVILNILSPSNYKEFKRILSKDGHVIKVVPGSGYLKELREAFYNSDEKKDYTNENTVSLFKQHFELLDIFNVKYIKKLNNAELHNIVQMTPLAWSAEKEQISTFVSRDSAEITVDLNILVGANKI